jgi:hypothetical protein
MALIIRWLTEIVKEISELTADEAKNHQDVLNKISKITSQFEAIQANKVWAALMVTAKPGWLVSLHDQVVSNVLPKCLVALQNLMYSLDVAKCKFQAMPMLDLTVL